MIFYFVISEVTKNGNFFVMLVASISSGLGMYLMTFVNNKYSKDKQYTNYITCSDIEEMKKFGDFCREEQITVITNKSFDYDISKTLTAIVFSKTKNESKKIDNYIENANVSFLRKIIY